MNNFKILTLLILGLALFLSTDKAKAAYDPEFKPSDFTLNSFNKYFSIAPGTKTVYEGKSEDGKERVEVLVTNSTKTILGVKTRVIRDKAWVDGELVEDTRDYLVQNKNGDIWYFGEDVDNYENGKIVDHKGSWLAGKDNAKPGIWVKNDPKVGETYRQEFLKGVAEDQATVVRINETVTTPFGKFENCLRTKDFSKLEPAIVEYKFYCPEVKNTVLELSPAEKEKLVLTIIKQGNNASDDEDND